MIHLVSLHRAASPHSRSIVLLAEGCDRFSASPNSRDGCIHTFLYDDIQNDHKLQDTIRDIIQSGYAEIGGQRTPIVAMYADPCSRYRVFSTSANAGDYDAFCAVSIHKITNGYPRLRCIAGKGDFRTPGVYALVEYELAEDGYCFIAEVSGTIEHIYAKSNSYIVPNFFAQKVLGLTNQQFSSVSNDLFHYDHIYDNSNKLRKALYGFKNDKLFNTLTQTIKDDAKTWEEYQTYDNFRRIINQVIAHQHDTHESIQPTLDEDELFFLLDSAMEFFVRVYNMQHYDLYNEYPKQVFEQAEFLLYALKELADEPQYNETVQMYNLWRSKVSEFKLIAL